MLLSSGSFVLKFELVENNIDRESAMCENVIRKTKLYDESEKNKQSFVVHRFTTFYKQYFLDFFQFLM